MKEYYRFIVGNQGIYEVVEKSCPKNDPRRVNKPDGSWLPKVGMKYPGAISFWTEAGVKKYQQSGLMKWHSSVAQGKVEVIIIQEPKKVIYRDSNQIIIAQEEVRIKKKQSLEEFLKSRKLI